MGSEEMELMEEKRKGWILETVDLLRQRKARPDLVRISRMLERYHGVTLKETKQSLETLVNEGKVFKVHFKGSVSYRRCGKDGGNEQQKTSKYNNSTTNRIIQALGTITKQTGDGVTFADLEKWLISKNPDTRLVKLRLHTALLREMEANTVTKLSDNCYVLTESLPRTKGQDIQPETSTSSLPSTSKENQSKTTRDAVPEVKPDETSDTSEKNGLKRGRPLSKRKKIKKTHGPDFENPIIRRNVNKENKNEEPTCDFCSCTAKSNSQGVPEQLLTCKDCKAKVHPSCMDYSEKLARRALNSPWQCMDCKTCCVCDGEGNDDLIVFCDECDKGYHLTCHTPILHHNPKGTWVCQACKVLSEKEDKADNTNTNNKTVEKEVKHEEEEEETARKSTKRKLSKSSSPELKRQKSNTSSADDMPQNTSSIQNSTVQNSIQNSSTQNDGKESTETPSLQSINTTYTQNNDLVKYNPGKSSSVTEGASCLLTPNASPRPSDTFNYEMKMSLHGRSLSITEDKTVYRDASNWTVDEVVEFFNNNGHTEQARIFMEQEIDGPSLLLLKREDVLTALGIKLGPALKIYQKILKLQQCSNPVNLS